MRIALAARVFTVAALTSLAAVAGQRYLDGALLVVLTAAVAQSVAMTRRLPEWVVAVAEGTVVALLATVAYPEQATVTPYLVIPVLIAAVGHGRTGVLWVLGAEFLALLGGAAVLVQEWDRQFVVGGFTWLATAIGTGLMGSALRRAMTTSEAEASYRSAVGLIRRLEALSGKLSGGLDAVGIAEQVMAEADDLAPTRSAGVFVRSPGGAMAPLRYSAGTLAGSMTWAESLAATCWDQKAMMLREQHLAMPLIVDDEVIAVLVADTLREIDAATALELRSRLARQAVQLQAALLFGRVRDAATSEERQRIAREVHDGVAQDVASLGYLVDNLAAVSTEPAQLEQIARLRTELTRVVTELRHSIFDLRHELAASAGLGESLTAYANRISVTSPMAVHVTLDEQGPRLPTDVEYELLRIAQEAMANARKHSGAANLWLRCTIRSPFAEIEVGDDGIHPHARRSDSQGLAIMQERSRSIGADLLVVEPTVEQPGTRVTVRVGSPSSDRNG